MNWEFFLDNYFEVFKPSVKKYEYVKEISLNYEFNGIYIHCSLETNRVILKKLEFGRLVKEYNNENVPNWIKGVYKSDEQSDLKFLQTSWFGEGGKSYKADFNEENKTTITNFLRIPCYSGWIEKEFWIKEDCYKIIAETGNVQNSITLLDIGEQDIPYLFDKVNQWLRVRVYDAFWNKKRREVKKIVVKPMNPKIM